MKKYHYLVVGGTFDHLHQGHQQLLETAFFYADKVAIGLTSDSLIKDKLFNRSIESFYQRKKQLLAYLQQKKWRQRAKIIPLNDPYGPSIKEKKYQAIVVSSATKKAALQINKIREKNHLSPLKTIEVKMICGDDNNIISSERVRSGEINRLGKNYFQSVCQLFENHHKIVLPESLKEDLRKPLGRVFFGDESKILSIGKKLVDYIKRYQPVLTITVGDMVAYSLIANNLIPSIKIVDYHSKKRELSQELKKKLDGNFHFKLNNKVGSLGFSAVKSIKKAVENFLTKNEFQRIFVNGEEDLLTLPAIAFSPLKSMVIYGHWQLGAIVVEVDEEKKEMALALMRKFMPAY
jgi:pantetheine-phosphate adenylyltransferase